MIFFTLFLPNWPPDQPSIHGDQTGRMSSPSSGSAVGLFSQKLQKSPCWKYIFSVVIIIISSPKCHWSFPRRSLNLGSQPGCIDPSSGFGRKKYGSISLGNVCLLWKHFSRKDFLLLTKFWKTSCDVFVHLNLWSNSSIWAREFFWKWFITMNWTIYYITFLWY